MATTAYLVGDARAVSCDVGSGTAPEYAAAGRAAGYAAHSYGCDWIIVEAHDEAEALERGAEWDAITRAQAGFEREAFVALVVAEEGRGDTDDEE